MLRGIFLLLFTVPAFAASTLAGKVVGIIDGDTLTLLVERRQVKIRLAEIDAPEKGQAFGKRATQALARLTFQKAALVVIVDYDRYGRTVGRVFADGVDVSAEMVRQGYAWAFRKYLRDPEILKLETDARRAGRGLWTDARPVPPWGWRRGIRTGWKFEDSQIESPAAFTCGTKKYCRQMTSCEEAQFYLERCGLTRIDGDGDGVPCESICR